MIEYRHARPEEYDAYCAFADLVFADNGTDICFRDSLPKVYGPDANAAYMQRIAYDSEKGIRGLVAVLPNTLHLGAETLKTGYIGTVSVHPMARGEGHMKALMAMCIDEMRSDGTDIVLLGGQRQRYEYFGFVPAGGMLRHVIRRANIRHALKDVDASAVSFHEILSGEENERKASALHALRRNRFDREPFAVVCQSYYRHLWGVYENGELIAFLVADREKGNVDDLCLKQMTDLDRILKAWFLFTGRDTITIEVPEWECEMNAHLRTWVEYSSMQSNVCARILNYPKAVGAFLRVKADMKKLTDGTLSFECEGQRFTVMVENNMVTVTEGGEEPLVLDTIGAGRLFMEALPYEGRPELPVNWFPLPVFKTEPDAF